MPLALTKDLGRAARWFPALAAETRLPVSAGPRRVRVRPPGAPRRGPAAPLLPPQDSQGGRHPEGPPAGPVGLLLAEPRGRRRAGGADRRAPGVRPRPGGRA